MNDLSDSNGVRAPLLQVISGEAAEEEIAAVLVVLLARSSRPAGMMPAQASLWADPAARHRGGQGSFSPGRDTWRTSSWPR
jgi:hypothetical protein